MPAKTLVAISAHQPFSASLVTTTSLNAAQKGVRTLLLNTPNYV